MFLRDVSVLQELWWSVTLSLVLGFPVVQGPHQREMPEEGINSFRESEYQIEPGKAPCLLTLADDSDGH